MWLPFSNAAYWYSWNLDDKLITDYTQEHCFSHLFTSYLPVCIRPHKYFNITGFRDQLMMNNPILYSQFLSFPGVRLSQNRIVTFSFFFFCDECCHFIPCGNCPAAIVWRCCGHHWWGFLSHACATHTAVLPPSALPSRLLLWSRTLALKQGILSKKVLEGLSFHTYTNN